MTMGIVLTLLVLQMLRVSADGEDGSNNCQINDNCAKDRLCAKGTCIDPCQVGVCGQHTLCHVQNHVPMCACQKDYVGHPFTGCILPPAGSIACKSTTYGRLSPNPTRKQFHPHYDTKKSWIQAVAHCISLNMSLATIESEKENNQLAAQTKAISLTLPGRWWIGGSDLTGDFMWTSTGKHIVFDKYNGGQPDNFEYANREVEHCLEFRPDWGNKWNDYLCDYHQYFVCEEFTSR